MQKILNINDFNVSSVLEDKFWNFGTNLELKMHRIHSYPAKFPYFLIEKGVEYIKKKGKNPKLIADVFCGCGTTALEAQLLGLDFWGCDINPVATLIARVKSQQYDEETIKKIYLNIIDNSKTEDIEKSSLWNNERIQYWFSHDDIIKIEKILYSIRVQNIEDKYKDFFICALSNILKPVSRWLTKSIKPQKDPNKVKIAIYEAYDKQIKIMLKANKETNDIKAFSSKSSIVTANFLELNSKTINADLVITSPPYVTSYEYADLHQLSTLVLNYADDYKHLRKGTIGSVLTTEFNTDLVNSIHHIGKNIYWELHKVDKSKARSVAKYFVDIDKCVSGIYDMLNNDGYCILVIGNTNYKGIEIDNVSVLINSLNDKGFKDIEITQRKISGKILTPYRDEFGKFSNSGSGKKVYSHEYILVAKK
jgi:DNA methylase